MPLKVCFPVVGVGYLSDLHLMPYLEASRFEPVTMICTFGLNYNFISTLVERWRLETHTFHLSCGEYTITFEDVALQLGIPIDGSAVMGVSTVSGPTTFCYDLLGHSPSDGGKKFTSLRFND
ncbi:hypothetical protein J1N35_019049 [Gossypium stocksii]|uniref:Aminotransferase-like plant mobile domain-containing protein n=1 Tax=Gossypium stocksii TaxID=47602 RepID=A0A9D4A5I5_9ROSI|nr:hypothetical protein J1N35_019049 [Gossypium stocksii]